MDPRDEVIDSNDEMTASEDEEVINLQKEYDIRMKELMDKRGHKEINETKSKFAENLQNQRPTKKLNYDNRIFEFDTLEENSKEVDESDPIIKEKLRLKYHEFSDVERALSNIKVVNVNKALAKIHKPYYQEPNYDNWAFIGYITHKTDPLMTKKNEKFMKLSVGNFKNTISVNLFKKSFNRYWKLSIGELIIILNPGIYKKDNGFEFYLNDDLNNIMALGMISNISQCEDPDCKTYISNKFQYCERHEIKQEKKFLKNKRMELNGSVKMFNPNEINEQTKTYGSESQFNSRLYDKSSIIKPKHHNDRKKRMIQDEHINKKLESKLMSANNSDKYRKLGLLKSNDKETTENKISTTNKNNDLKNELTKLTKSRTNNLTKSKHDKVDKLNKWKKNITSLENYKRGNLSTSPKKETTTSQKFHKSNDFNSDSDDDIIIV